MDALSAQTQGLSIRSLPIEGSTMEQLPRLFHAQCVNRLEFAACILATAAQNAFIGISYNRRSRFILWQSPDNIFERIIPDCIFFSQRLQFAILFLMQLRQSWGDEPESIVKWFFLLPQHRAVRLIFMPSSQEWKRFAAVPFLPPRIRIPGSSPL